MTYEKVVFIGMARRRDTEANDFDREIQDGLMSTDPGNETSIS